MISLKPGISLAGIRPETVAGLTVVSWLFAELGIEATVTSVTEGAHSFGSLHYAGFAFDIRTKHMQDGEVDRAVIEAQRRLNAEWDVVKERDHIHFEWQPKGPVRK